MAVLVLTGCIKVTPLPTCPPPVMVVMVSEEGLRGIKCAKVG